MLECRSRNMSNWRLTFMSEEWRPVVTWEGSYEVSDQGRVRSLDHIDSLGRTWRGKVLKPTVRPDGRLTVTLHLGNRRERFRVHRLVLESFVGPCPDGMECCHWDDNPANNHLENLRWDTRSANAFDNIRNGNHPEARKTHCPHGHRYSEENTYRSALGSRHCRICTREQQRAAYWDRKRKAA